jgi:hypothetical protein
MSMSEIPTYWGVEICVSSTSHKNLYFSAFLFSLIFNTYKGIMNMQMVRFPRLG